MDENKTAIDLDFRPRGYFWSLDLGVTPHAFIKGAERRAMVERMYAAGREVFTLVLWVGSICLRWEWMRWR